MIEARYFLAAALGGALWMAWYLWRAHAPVRLLWRALPLLAALGAGAELARRSLTPARGIVVQPPPTPPDMAPPRLERGQLLANDQPLYAGEPLAEGCSSEAGWEAGECHLVGKP